MLFKFRTIFAAFFIAYAGIVSAQVEDSTGKILPNTTRMNVVPVPTISNDSHDCYNPPEILVWQACFDISCNSNANNTTSTQCNAGYVQTGMNFHYVISGGLSGVAVAHVYGQAQCCKLTYKWVEQPVNSTPIWP